MQVPDRPINDVLDDVLDGYVTAKSATQDYGLVFYHDSFEVDFKKTMQHRAKLKRPKEMFHRYKYYNAIDDRAPET